MTINEINLDSLSKEEYLHLIYTLIEYYYVIFNEKLTICEYDIESEFKNMI